MITKVKNIVAWFFRPFAKVTRAPQGHVLFNGMDLKADLEDLERYSETEDPPPSASDYFEVLQVAVSESGELFGIDGEGLESLSEAVMPVRDGPDRTLIGVYHRDNLPSRAAIKAAIDRFIANQGAHTSGERKRHQEQRTPPFVGVLT